MDREVGRWTDREMDREIGRWMDREIGRWIERETVRVQQPAQVLTQTHKERHA